MENYKVPGVLENPLLLNTVVNSTILGLLNNAGLSGLRILDAQNNPYQISEIQKGLVKSDIPNPKFISKLGTVVYSNLIFNAGVILNSTGVEDNWDDYRIDDLLLSVGQSKKIITTEIQGRDGTIKEYIGADDFQISITGRISGGYNVYPKERVKELKKILSAKQPLAVTSWYLQNLNITDIVVKDFEFGQTEGEYSTQYFKINAMSDAQQFAELITQ